MKHMILKLAVLCTALIMLFNNCVCSVAFASENAVTNITTPGGIEKAGLTPSSVYSRDGSYAARWNGSNTQKNITIPVTKNNWSDMSFLECWVYSKAANDSSFSLVLKSDNPDTVYPDYYYTDVSINWTGWKLLSFGLENDFTAVNDPVGMNDIQSIELWVSHSGQNTALSTDLYFNNFILKEERSAEAINNSGDGNKLVLADFSSRAEIAATGFPASKEHTVEGKQYSLKMAAPDLFKSSLQITPPEDWSDYAVLNLMMYSSVANGSVLRVVVLSENPATDGADYYMGEITLDWTGWREIQFFIGPASSMTKSRTPLGWDKITGLTFWSGFGGVTMAEDSELYIDSIYLTKQSTDNSSDYIIPAQSKEDDEDITALFKEKNPEMKHPHILFDGEYLEELKSLVKTDAYLIKSYQALIATANGYLETTPMPYGLADGLRLSRYSCNMMPVLALAYNLSGDERYAERLWAEMETVCAFPDWNPNHFLDVGDYARGVAYAYDWMYNHWTDEQRRIVRNAIVRNAFVPSMLYLRTGTHFYRNTNNWNQVCLSGLGLSALAIIGSDGYDDIVNEVLNRVIDGLPNGISSYGPDGAALEGMSYWEYANQTFFQFDAGMYSSLETDYGLGDLPGMSNTGYYPISATGSTNRSFNFGDGYENQILDPCLFWIARRYDKPDIADYLLEMQPNGGNWCAMAMYRQSDEHENFRDILPKDILFRGRQPIVSMRASWYDSDALSAVMKGGDNTAGHNDLDIGSFVLDALGVRWVCELGSESYDVEGMWDNGVGGGRWTYYRKRAEGSNTLVINPDSGDDQYPLAVCEFTDFKANDCGSYAVVDMSEAYKDDASSVKRGIAMVNNHSSMLLQDEIKTNGPSEIYSFMHTATDVTVAEDGRSAVMSLQGKRMQVNLLDPADGKLELMEAEPLKTSPKPVGGEANTPNTGIRKLAVHLTNASNPTISLLFTPLSPGETDQDITYPKLYPLADWEAYLNSKTLLSSLTVDSIPIEGFSPYITSYTLTDGILGKIEAISMSDGADIEIQQANYVGDTAYVRVRTNDGEKSIYKVTFTEKIPAVIYDRAPVYEIKGVSASAEPQPENAIANAADGNLSTRWSAEGEQWIEVDLGSVMPVDSAMIAFYSGTTRNTNFDISLSSDGQNYRTVFEGASSGKTDDFESFDFDRTEARYIRINGKGNSINKWNSISEIKVSVPPIEYDDMTDHWARNDVETIANIGLVNGVDKTHFAPEKSVTRAEFIAMMARAANVTAEESEGIFADAKNGWYTGIIDAAYKNNMIPSEMISGDNVFPDAPITREEMCAVMIKTYEFASRQAAPSYGLRFSDAKNISEWASDYVSKGVALRLIKGVTENEFMPKSEATRAQAAVMVKRWFYKLNS